MNTITKVDVDAYRYSPVHRGVADAVLAKAGLSKMDVSNMDLVDGTWYITVYQRRDGKFYVVDGHVATEMVTFKVDSCA